jgi:uncharacterized alpha-E superfamily protein
MPIDLIVRCVAGSSADPLELDAADFAGPVGLLQVVRRQPGLVVNALGSALAENRGLSAYLPALARLILGEDLLLEDGQRWWLGDAANLAHVATRIGEVFIRTAHEGTARPGRAVPGIDPAGLDTAAVAALLQEIEIGGAGLVAEAKIGFGTTPSLTPDGLVPTPYALRLFVTATSDGFAVLPGGLAMTVDPDKTVALSAPDGHSRDVWVIGEAPPPPFTSLWRPTIEAARIRRIPEELPSRAAENLYWLGRYTERADWTMRVLRTSLGRLQEDTDARQSLRACYTALSSLLPAGEGEPAGRRDAVGPQLIEELALGLMTLSEEPAGLPRTLDSIHRIASLARDRLSLEAWRTLNEFHTSRRWCGDAMPAARCDALRLLDDGLRVLAAFNGLAHENITRSFGWTFLDLGRRLARAQGVAALLGGMFGTAASPEEESGSLLFTLEVADSFITYRSRYRLEPMLPLVLDLLLLDDTNPRSIAFQLERIAGHVDSLPQSATSGRRIEEQRLALSLVTAVRLADVAPLAETDGAGARPGLSRLLDEQSCALDALSDLVGRRYFNLVEKGVRWVRAGERGAERP